MIPGRASVCLRSLRAWHAWKPRATYATVESPIRRNALNVDARSTDHTSFLDRKSNRDQGEPRRTAVDQGAGELSVFESGRALQHHADEDELRWYSEPHGYIRCVLDLQHDGDHITAKVLNVRHTPASTSAEKQSQEVDEVVDHKLPLQWFLDQCKCDKCTDPTTKQRNVDVLNLSDRNEEFSLRCLITDEQKLELHWEGVEHVSTFTTDWLLQAVNNAANVARVQGVPPSIHNWTSFNGNSGKQSIVPIVNHDIVMDADGHGLAQWTRQIREYGFCFVQNTPVDETATEKLITRIGPLVNTHYGAFHRMTSDLSSKDTAYTQVALPPHNDTTYFSSPIGLQMLHLLEHTASTTGEPATGGESFLVDGFAAAEILRTRHPQAFEALVNIRVFAHASGNEGISLQGAEAHPVIKVDRDTLKVTQIRWNNADRAQFALPLPLLYTRSKDWYAAARTFRKILEEDQSVRYTFQLEPGKPVVFDNWRVLHGRGAFTGKRSMCGGYVDRDYFVSTYKMSNMGGPTL